MRLPKLFVEWIMACATTVFPINISLVTKRGVRQGDTISPLLFVLVMEYLSRCLMEVQRNQDFSFHLKCEKLGILNLKFADDLLVFSSGDTGTVHLMMNQIQNFSEVTGLKMNKEKCKVHYSGRE